MPGQCFRANSAQSWRQGLAGGILTLMTHHTSEPKDDFKRSAELVKVVDGDTLRLNVDLGWTINVLQDIRIAWADAPESNLNPWVPAGQWVTEQIVQLVGDKTEAKIHSLEFVVGKYGRCVSDVWIAGINIGKWLLEQKMAWPMDERGRRLCDRDIDLLTGIPEHIREQVREWKP
jgi:endonuclease YncB( thermonuclease family)